MTPHEWAALLERAKMYADYITAERIIDLAQSGVTSYGTLRDAEKVREVAASDAAALRTLAAAMRDGVVDEGGFFILTLPEAP